MCRGEGAKEAKQQAAKGVLRVCEHKKGGATQNTQAWVSVLCPFVAESTVKKVKKSQSLHGFRKLKHVFATKSFDSLFLIHSPTSFLTFLSPHSYSLAFWSPAYGAATAPAKEEGRRQGALPRTTVNGRARVSARRRCAYWPDTLQSCTLTDCVYNRQCSDISLTSAFICASFNAVIVCRARGADRIVAALQRPCKLVVQGTASSCCCCLGAVQPHDPLNFAQQLCCYLACPLGVFSHGDFHVRPKAKQNHQQGKV